MCFLLYMQGCGLTKGWEGPGPPLFVSDYGKSRVGDPQFLSQTMVKVGLGPHFFRSKGPKIEFCNLGPFTFKSMTMSLHSLMTL